MLYRTFLSRIASTLVLLAGLNASTLASGQETGWVGVASNEASMQALREWLTRQPTPGDVSESEGEASNQTSAKFATITLTNALPQSAGEFRPRDPFDVRIGKTPTLAEAHSSRGADNLSTNAEYWKGWRQQLGPKPILLQLVAGESSVDSAPAWSRSLYPRNRRSLLAREMYVGHVQGDSLLARGRTAETLGSACRVHSAELKGFYRASRNPRTLRLGSNPSALAQQSLFYGLGFVPTTALEIDDPDSAEPSDLPTFLELLCREHVELGTYLPQGSALLSNSELGELHSAGSKPVWIFDFSKVRRAPTPGFGEGNPKWLQTQCSGVRLSALGSGWVWDLSNRAVTPSPTQNRDRAQIQKESELPWQVSLPKRDTLELDCEGDSILLPKNIERALRIFCAANRPAKIHLNDGKRRLELTWDAKTRLLYSNDSPTLLSISGLSMAWYSL